MTDGYDGDGRLDAVTENRLPVPSYGYDQNDNRVSVNAAMIATYDNQDRLLTFGSNSYAYNANGELLAYSLQSVLNAMRGSPVNLPQVSAPDV